MSQLDIFDLHDNIFIKQQKEIVEIILDWETANRYTAFDKNKVPLMYIAERKKGFFDTIRRFILRSHRPLEIDVFDVQKIPFLNLTRPFYWFWSDLVVQTNSGQKIGSVHRRFSIFFKTYTLKDELGRSFATVKSPFWRLWTFPVLNYSDKLIATISKKWSGVLSEVFTDADAFLIEFKLSQKLPLHKSIIFAAAISIDFDYFENNQGSRGLINMFDRS